MSLARDLLAPRLVLLLDPEALFLEAYGFPPLDWQVPYLWERRNAVLLKGRQVGASTATALLAIRQARYCPGTLAAVVSPSLKQSTEVKLKAKGGLERLGEDLRIDSASVVGLRNGSRIMSLPGSAKSVRGWTADLLVIDEAAFLDQETFLAARATVATGGRIVVQSTPAGPFGHFNDLWKSEEGWAKYRVRSDEVSTITAEFLATERATMGEEEYAQEYCAEFSVPGLGLVDPARLAELTLEPGKVPGAPGPPTAWDRLESAP